LNVLSRADHFHCVLKGKESYEHKNQFDCRRNCLVAFAGVDDLRSEAEWTKVTREYHVWNSSSWQEATGKLHMDGNEGWELVSVTETPTTFEGSILRPGSVTIYLKRAK
jgi:hypothetical protein